MRVCIANWRIGTSVLRSSQTSYNRSSSTVGENRDDQDESAKVPTKIVEKEEVILIVIMVVVVIVIVIFK